LGQVWNRQVRWARLRRATFPAFYVPELLTGSALPIASGVFAAQAFGYEPLAVLSCLMLVWFGTEALLARTAGWHIGIFSPLAWVLRDLLLPVLWLEGWSGNKFVWRGNDMSVSKSAGTDRIANQLT
jgi:ceramide glucosyltransferase